MLSSYERIIQENPEKTYRISCFGYVDNQPVQGLGISYEGSGRFKNVNDPTGIVYNTPDGSFLPKQVDNDQLSYARAFEGIKSAHNAFSLPSIYNVEFVYRGMGEDPLSRDNKKQRRIEFLLEEI